MDLGAGQRNLGTCAGDYGGPIFIKGRTARDDVQARMQQAEQGSEGRDGGQYGRCGALQWPCRIREC